MATACASYLPTPLFAQKKTRKGNAYEAIPGYTKEETEDIYDEMLRTLCTPMRFGTHYGATSTK